MNRPWIFFGIQAKENSIRRMLAERLSESEYVIFVPTPISAIRQPLYYSLGQRIHHDPFGATKYFPFHTPEDIPGLTSWLRRLNHRRFIRELKELLGVPPLVVCYDSPNQWDLVRKLGEWWSVYLAVDDRTLKVTGEPIPGEELAERKLLTRVDWVVCVSESLANRLRERAPARLPIYVLPNGYDERLFNPEKVWPEPPSLKNIPRPRLLITGHISDRIDWDSITEASRMRPIWSWVFIGPADRGMVEKITAGLGERGHYFHPVSVREIPAWIQHCEICAALYRLNSFTLTSDPLKVIEYLAMGAATVSTRVPSLARYDGAITWVEEKNGASLAQALDQCFTHGNHEELRILRQQAVAQDSWSSRATQFRQMVSTFLSTQPNASF